MICKQSLEVEATAGSMRAHRRLRDEGAVSGSELGQGLLPEVRNCLSPSLGGCEPRPLRDYGGSGKSHPPKANGTGENTRGTAAPAAAGATGSHVRTQGTRLE